MDRKGDGLKKCCLICNESGGDDLRCNPEKQYLEKVREVAKKRCAFGETKYITALKRIESITEEQFLGSVYHSSCYKDLTHAGKLKRAETRHNEYLTSGKVVPIKRGRRSIDEKSRQAETDRIRLQRCREKQKIKSCIFQCSNPDLGTLHRVESVTRGEKTSDPKVKVALANISEPLDCAAYDLHYHQDCLRNQERKVACIEDDRNATKNTIGKYISDIELLNSVRYSLSCGSQVRHLDSF